MSNVVSAVDHANIADVRALNRVTLWKLLAIVPVMWLFCASMVPLYRQICQVLGISATKAVPANTQIDSSRKVKVEFVANVNQNFAWSFEPIDKMIEVHPGAFVTINYRVTNRTSSRCMVHAVSHTIIDRYKCARMDFNHFVNGLE